MQGLGGGAIRAPSLTISWLLILWACRALVGSPKAMINPAELVELSAVDLYPGEWQPCQCGCSFPSVLSSSPFHYQTRSRRGGEPLGNSTADFSHFSLPASVSRVTPASPPRRPILYRGSCRDGSVVCEGCCRDTPKYTPQFPRVPAETSCLLLWTKASGHRAGLS